MEAEMSSVILSGEANINSDVSDSTSTTHQANKRQRCGGKGNSSQYKGVMRQKNGQWGAQLYTNHTRIWLGTFKSEIDAAMAYDSAAIKFRTRDTHRNFPWNEITIEEPTFLSHYSAEAVLSMIRDGSYQYKFMDFIKAHSGNTKLNLVGTYSNEGLICKQLFQKELTPSDVGQLNRLVIPKKYAVKYFPPVSGTEKENADVGHRKTNDVELIFYDKFMRIWKFRYCYWNSSQSFVFTRGWNRFLKEKELKANDVVSFFVCECRKENEVRRFCMIDANKSGNGGTFVWANNVHVGIEVDLQLRLGHCYLVQEEQGSMAAAKPKQDDKTEGFKLFGMQIS
ncbi:hypothetical protein ES332_D13G218100v1 [Gossypium tomentosum]|uniref:AP2/ERF domain-containing protein n=1 Tax=Gossypium tomentosum TaxID=34277 RepID=A0A5D2I0A4_GOSTO|nr:hypothetical protein ES332_D13G218100v1 [Gossypium tomentosum]